MSVRRLADDAVQPEDFAFSNDNAVWAARKIAEYPEGRQQSAVIPLLWRAQEQEGWVTRAAIERVADMLGMAYIRVLEVATFYTQFQLAPVGTRAHVQVCGTTPCMLRGAEDLRRVCQRTIHPEAHHTNAEGTLSWEEVECLGACVNAPMVMIGDDTYEDLTPERLEEIVLAFGRGEGESVAPGPQNGRRHAMAVTGQTSLFEIPSGPRRQETGEEAPPQEPTTPGRKREVTEEAAPAVRGPSEADEAKVSVAEAEAERKAADRAAGATGEPARAMRPEATGAESPAAKVDGGEAVEKGDGPGTQVRAHPPAADALFAQPEGAPDDLRLISGVGPVLERKLHGQGVTQFAQIAAFTAEDIARLDERLKFRGRIARDNWVGQADALATGGVAEYVKRFGREPR